MAKAGLEFLSYHADAQSFYLESLLTQINFDWLIVRVFREQHDLVALSGTLKSLHGNFIVDAGDDNLTIACFGCFVNGKKITVQYARLAHAVAAYA